MTPAAGLTARLRDAVGARSGEGAVLLWASAYYFLVLAAYYVLRPIRDDIGAASGAENLAWLFTGTMVGMLAVHPLYTSLVSRLPRHEFISLAYRFFIANLVIFYVVFRTVDASQSVWVGRVFFIWTSVFNLFVVSVFWSLITDIFRPGQGKRLFGIVAVGGTLGAISGSTITTALVGVVGPLNLMLASALILELAVRAAKVLDKAEAGLRAADEGTVAAGAAAGEKLPRASGSSSDEVIGGGVLDGIKHIASSPYLLGIASLILFYTISSTFLYFQQADIVSRTFGDESVRRPRVIGSLDVAVNGLTLVAQLVLTGRVMKWFGVGFALAFLPVVTMVGFGIMSIAPVLGVLVVFQVVRRASNFAIQRPGREALFTVLPRTDKYKAKNFSDTTVYRLGDQVGAWSYAWMAIFGLGLYGLAFSMVPLSAAWLVLTIWLGRRYARLESGVSAAQHPSTAVPSAARLSGD
ncbi:MAG: NTP/NDP exchange transporter [Gemmatimonadaceae bacterium]